MVQAPEARASLPDGWRSFFAGQQVKCPVCNGRVGDVVAARIQIRVARPAVTDDGEPSLIVKCSGFLPVSTVQRPSGPGYTRQRCGTLLELQMSRIARERQTS